MFAAWAAYPLVLAVLCAGVGLLVDRLVGRSLPGALVLPVGLAGLVVVGGFTTATDVTAGATVPLLTVLAVAGLVASRPYRFKRPDPGPVLAALGVFLVFGAPVILSGKPTFAGYITLDDTATWLAMTDRVLEHGRGLVGLEPSTYRSTLDFNLAGGYPVGAFIPFGAAQRFSGGDLAWVFQPYVSFLAAMLALCLWNVLGDVARGRVPRALAAFLVAQPALLFGYALWGGVKEVAAAVFLALAAALAPAVVREGASRRAVVPLALAAAALVGVLSPGGVLWVGPMLAVLAVLAHQRFGPGGAAWRALLFAVLLLVLVAPVLAEGLVPPTSKSLVGSDGEGNLRGPLNALQVLGIWPSGDFRFDPHLTVPSTVLVGLGLAAAAVGGWGIWRRRAWAPLLLASALLTCAVIAVAGSPWAAGKALATASPAALALAAIGALVALRLDRVAGAILVAAVSVGVLWSNALAYHDVSLAPYEQLRELEEIGEAYAGGGPALITEYQPYGARHFLRQLDAEGASELRFRPVTLVDGTTLEKGQWADTDRIALSALLTYRTLVLRRSPVQSRPPSAYSLVGRGDYYEVWQRPANGDGGIVEHLPLGDETDPGGVPECAELVRLGALAGPGGAVMAARRGPNVSAALAAAERPADWVASAGERPELRPLSGGSARLRLEVSRGGRYDLFVQGSARNRLALTLDGIDTGSVSVQRNPDGQYLDLGRATLSAGSHLVRLSYAGPSLAPGSGGPPYATGPLVLSPVRDRDPPLLRVPASRARQLCDQRLDWAEAVDPDR